MTERVQTTQTTCAGRDAQAYARERGVLAPLYLFVRLLAIGVLRLWFRVRVTGAEHIPADGPAVIAPNHKNLLDAFFVALATRRHLRYMAKVELFKGPLGWLLLRLGAFPVRRREADAQALQTARTILTNGGLVVVFPEGTRVREPSALGSPRHGAGRLALETGAPVIPAAITGTAHLWRGAIPKLKRVQLTLLPAVSPDEALGGEDPSSDLIDDHVWPAVQGEYGRLRATPGLIAAGLAAIGLGGGLIAKRRSNAKRTPRRLERLAPRKPRRRNERRRLLGPIRSRR